MLQICLHTPLETLPVGKQILLELAARHIKFKKIQFLTSLKTPSYKDMITNRHHLHYSDQIRKAIPPVEEGCTSPASSHPDTQLSPRDLFLARKAKATPSVQSQATDLSFTFNLPSWTLQKPALRSLQLIQFLQHNARCHSRQTMGLLMDA